MKIVITILIFISAVIPVNAQRITREYNNVSLSEALRQLNEQTEGYTISFLYNELEDFRVTTSIHRKSVPDAIRQMIGFYPIRMTIENREIIVECPQKTAPRYKGTIIDEQGQPIAYANIALLSPQDSTLITGGVSNESGLFVIPCEQRPVLARVSYVGYKTVYRQCNGTEFGKIRMQPETQTLKGVTVKGERIISGTENGHLIYNMPMLLGVYPADNAYEALTRIPGVVGNGGNLIFCGQPVTLIINGRATTLTADKVIERLKSMPAVMLAKAEVMPSTPAKYHVRGMAINVITKDFAGTNQLSGQLKATYHQSKYATGLAGGSFIYNHGRLGIDASYTFTDGKRYGKVEHEAYHPLGDERIAYKDKTHNHSKGLSHEYRIGVDYAFSDDHRLNAAYTGEWNRTSSINTSTGTATSIQNSLQHIYMHNVDVGYTLPIGLKLGASYTDYQTPRTQTLDGQMFDTKRDISVDSRQKVGKWLFTADQTHTFKKGWELNYGVMTQFTRNSSFQTTLDEHRKPIAHATSQVDYDERILNAYAGFSKQIGKSLSLDASLTVEQYKATIWNDWRVYPQFNAMWNINEHNMLNLSFSSQSRYPSYWSTMSDIYYASNYMEIWGNPDLRPMEEYDINLMWQLNRKYTFTAFAGFEPDFFAQLPYQTTDRMAVIMKETNFDYSHFFGLRATAQFRIGKWLNGQIMGRVLYRNDKSSHFFDLPFNRTRLSAYLSGTAVVKLSQRHGIQFILNPSYQSKAIQGIYDIAPLFRMNASLRWTSASGKWSVIARTDNLFNSHIDTRSTVCNQNYAMRYWMNYRSGSLTAVYRIGNFKEKKKKAVDTSRMGY